MIFRMQYGKVGKYDRGTINIMKPYETYSKSRRLPAETTLWDLYTRYALENIAGVPRNVKKECIVFVTYRSFYYNRTRYWQTGAPESHFIGKGVACYE